MKWQVTFQKLYCTWFASRYEDYAGIVKKYREIDFSSVRFFSLNSVPQDAPSDGS